MAHNGDIYNITITLKISSVIQTQSNKLHQIDISQSNQNNTPKNTSESSIFKSTNRQLEHIINTIIVHQSTIGTTKKDYLKQESPLSPKPL